MFCIDDGCVAVFSDFKREGVFEDSLIGTVSDPMLQVNIIPLPVTINRKTKKTLVKLNFWQSQ